MSQDTFSIHIDDQAVKVRELELGEFIHKGDIYLSTDKTWQAFPISGCAHSNPDVKIVRPV